MLEQQTSATVPVEPVEPLRAGSTAGSPPLPTRSGHGRLAVSRRPSQVSCGGRLQREVEVHQHPNSPGMEELRVYPEHICLGNARAGVCGFLCACGPASLCCFQGLFFFFFFARVKLARQPLTSARDGR